MSHSSMDTLQPLLNELQDFFKRSTQKGKLFSAVILAMIMPIGSGMSSQIFRKLIHIVHYTVSRTRFYRFMASKCFNWDRIWQVAFKLIQAPLTDGRLIMALDDSTTPKSGKEIFACEHFFDHAAKHNQSKYPWSQCFVQLGLLKLVHTRWAFLPLLTQFYHSSNKVSSDCFSSKIALSCQMILKLSTWIKAPMLIVTDSWFGNGKLYNPLKDKIAHRIDILTMLRKNSALYNFPENTKIKKRGRPAKYGSQAGSVRSLANQYKAKAQKVTSFVYGKKREMLAYEEIFMSKSFKCPIKVVFAYYRNHFVALATTDANLTTTQIFEYYSARWKIESGFKELKHDIGSQKSQARLQNSVINHLNMCMLAITIVWIAVMNLSPNAVNELTHNGAKPQYTFSTARKLLIMNQNKHRVCHNDKSELKNHKKSWIQMIIELAA
jgi:hypothetical protein